MLNTLKTALRRLLLTPLRATVGRDTVMRRPFRVFNSRWVTIGSNTWVGPRATLHPILEYAGVQHGGQILIGSSVYIGSDVSIVGIGRIELGDGCVLSDHVYISDSAHGFDPTGPPIMDQPLASKGPITIGRNCFLGYRSAILPGVTLGERCIVGTNAVVTKSFPAYSVIGGVPARLIRTYGPDQLPTGEPVPTKGEPR